VRFNQMHQFESQHIRLLVWKTKPRSGPLNYPKA
jgi:hypothetical protein